MKTFVNYGVFKALILLLCLVSSCNKEASLVKPDEETGVSVKNGRLAFRDENAFFDVLKQLKKINTNEQATTWESKYSFTSLRKHNFGNREEARLTDMNLPLAYTTLLNENGEYAIGNTIVWFNNGYTHYIANLDEELLQKIKANPALSIDKKEVISKVVKSNSTEGLRIQGVINGQTGDARDARYQHEWLINNTSGDRRKTIYEIYSITVQVGPTSQGYQSDYTFYLNVKFEWWWPRRGWQPNASESHYVTLNLDGSSYPDCRPYASTAINIHEYIATTGDVQKVLASGPFYYNEYCSNNGLITYSIQGSIYTEVYMNGNKQTASPYTVGPGTLW